MFHDERGIVEILFGAAPQLRNNEVYGRQKPYVQIRLLDEVSRPLAIAGRHGDHRPTGKIFSQIHRNMLIRQELPQWLQRSGQFTSNVLRVMVLKAVSLKASAPNSNRLTEAPVCLTYWSSSVTSRSAVIAGKMHGLSKGAVVSIVNRAVVGRQEPPIE